MKLRRVAAFAVGASLFLSPNVFAAGPTPQITDPSGDANMTANAQNDVVTPAGSQDWADVTSVLWQTVKTRGRVTAFTVTATLKGAPTPPAPASLVFRMLGTTAKCPFFGVAYYTEQSSDATLPQSAIRDNCIDTTTRLTKIDLPVIKDNTITWTVPLDKIPADTGVKVGTTLTGLYFTVNEIEDFHGGCIPDNPVLAGPTCGLGTGVWDNSTAGDASFSIK
ncbi:MAG: hypothetical protein ABR520_06925 [Mycobacteriales bacterium]